MIRDLHGSMLNNFVPYKCLRMTWSLWNKGVRYISINPDTINGKISNQFTIQSKLIRLK